MIFQEGGQGEELHLVIALRPERGETDNCPHPVQERQTGEFLCIAWRVHDFDGFLDGQRGPPENQGWKTGQDIEKTVAVVQDEVDVCFGPQGVHHDEGGSAEG